MNRIFLIYISSLVITAAGIYYAGAQDHSGFKEKMIQFLENAGTKSDSAEPANPENNVFLRSDNNNNTFFKSGEWSEYVSNPESFINPEQFKNGNLYSDEKININASGSVNVNLNYGKSYYTSKKYIQYDEDLPYSRVIDSGFWPEQKILLHMDGTIGDRITVFIDHDSSRKENQYMLNYRALSDDEVIREINAGEIDIKFNHSRYAVYDNTDAKGLGVDFTLAKNDFTLKAFGSVARGETMVEYFKGNSSPSGIKIAEYQYISATYYQLEPFIRYDGAAVTPSGSGAYSLVTFTSAPANPAAYVLSPVNISPSDFELYVDDQNQYNNNNAIVLPLDGGYYTRMVSGSDYSINFSTGVIHLLKEFPQSSRIFAVYKRTGGTLDPCALSSGPGIFSNRIFVFIKYGYSIDEDRNKDLVLDTGEDRNGDGRVNLDIYEIRSVYFLGNRQILSSDFSIDFYKENQIMDKEDITKLSSYRLNLQEGLIQFSTREPFKSVLPADKAARIYTETKVIDGYLYSLYNMISEFNVEARLFKLKYSNVIDKSVRVKINEVELSPSLYSVDYESGYINFIDSNNPVISSDSRIEIKYEYLPFGSSSENFISGVRADYDLNKSLRLGGTIMFSKDGQSEIIPDIGNVSEQTLLFEGDASLRLSQKRLADLYNIFAERKKRSIPAEFSAYAEYAKSIKNVNTFGKALIDNMETSDEIVSVSLSEKDWILSSLPASYSQSSRGLLNYYFYRNPDSPETLKGEGYNSYLINYSVKSGPFNIAMGHVDSDITEQAYQKSLVFDSNFSAGQNIVSAVTRELTDTSIDLSGMQYVEVWVKYEGGASDSVDLKLDFGSVDEDSDGDGVFDTEDANRNGYIDSEPSTGYSEDRGYVFNPAGGTATKIGSGPGLSSLTKGDGVLTSEDLNGNGLLDITNNIYQVDVGTITPAGGVWQKLRVHIDWSTVSSSQIQALQQTKSIRLNLVRNNGSSGRVSIDTLKVISAKWKNPKLNDITPINDPETMKITLVNSISDSDYRNESFLIRERSLYKQLYGDESTDDIESESETALQIEYNLNAPDYASVIRKFSKEIDIRFYKTMNLWLNVRDSISSNVIGFIIGSSDSDFIEYRITPNFSMIWSEIKLKLSKDSSGNIDKYQVTGNPDLKRIKYIKAVVHGNGSSGKIWLNEIYVSEPETLEGDAKWYEFEMKTLRPLFKTASGVPVLSDMNLRYIYKGHSSQFSSVNKTSSDVEENYHELFASAKILPNWDTNFNYVNEFSRTDSLNEEVADAKKGDARRNFFMVNSVFNSTVENVPSITFSYSFDKNENIREAASEGSSYSEDSISVIHTPVILYRQDLEDFLYGKFSLRMILDMAFSHNKIDRDSSVIDDAMLSSSVVLSESEKKQKSDAKIELDYANSLFFFRPQFTTSSIEYVMLNGGDNYDETGVDGGLNGNFYLPFRNYDDSKFIERNNGTGFTLGVKFLEYLSPEYSMSVDYKENAFKDYKDETVIDEGFSRFKSTMSNLTSEITLPFQLRKIEVLKRVKNFQLNYQRSIYFNEADVPYEGEGTGLFDEEYGISNVLKGAASPAYNLISNYPGLYFRGRGNAGKGRDLLYNALNDDDGISELGSSSEYNNSLKLVDRLNADISVDADLFKFYSSGSISQVCERSNVYGIPNQVLIADTGVNFEFDLMKIFSFGFFRANGEGLSYHAANFDVGLSFTDSMLITYNINEKKIAPSAGFVFNWNRSSLNLKYEFEFRDKNNEEYISTSLEEDDTDFIYLQNMEGSSSFSEKDYGHVFLSRYETDIEWLYSFFSNFYKLTGIPLFSIEYRMEINRYDYFKTVAPEPYDLFMLSSNLNLDLHRNIQGSIGGKMAMEKFRNRENNGISREIMSYEVNAGISFIF